MYLTALDAVPFTLLWRDTRRQQVRILLGRKEFLSHPPTSSIPLAISRVDTALEAIRDLLAVFPWGAGPPLPWGAHSPTFPIAEAVPHSHAVRMPIAIAPEVARTGSQHRGGGAHPPVPTFPSTGLTYPRSPSSVLWISFRTPAG